MQQGSAGENDQSPDRFQKGKGNVADGLEKIHTALYLIRNIAALKAMT